MASRTILKRRLQFRTDALEKLYAAYEALSSGKVKAYTIDDRQLTYHSLPELGKEIAELEAAVDELTAELNGGSARRAVGVIPRDW